MFAIIIITVLIADPILFSPANLDSVSQWVHHKGVHHCGYDFDGRFYLNFPSLMFSEIPFHFYLRLLLV
jgi:hypothetical protein